MTSLRLSNALLDIPRVALHKKPWHMPALKELHLNNVELNGVFWLGFIATSLTSLTQLTFASCRFQAEGIPDIDFIAAESVRYISCTSKMMGSCFYVFLHNDSSCFEKSMKLTSSNGFLNIFTLLWFHLTDCQ